VVDTGTNSTRMLVADVEGPHFREVARRTQVTRLGEGVAGSGRLSDSAMKRVEQCFRGYQKLISYLGAQDNLLLATSSVRDAANGEDFIASLARWADFDHRILSGEQEAALTFSGASIGMPAAERMMVMDVGGGSTEVAAGSGGEADYSVSLDLGCVRLTESMLKHDPPEPAELSAAAAHTELVLGRGLDRDRVGKSQRAVAVAGTATSLAAIDLGLEEYDREKVHGHLMDKGTIESHLSMLAKQTSEERRRIPTLEEGRADVIVAGAMILAGVMTITGAEEIYISEKDLLDGAAIRYVRREL